MEEAPGEHQSSILDDIEPLMATIEQKLEDFLKEQVRGDKKPLTLEEIFQKTLDMTTPSQPGDVRNLKEYEKKKVEEWF